MQYAIPRNGKLWDKPLAVEGLTSYRYPSAYGGWVMIGATDHKDALREANRSLREPNADATKLEVWNGKQYIPAV
jgi:hypothetical protein